MVSEVGQTPPSVDPPRRKLRYAAKTDVGMKRTHNEDCFLLLEDDLLFMVADGMGGHASGEIAAKLATESLAEFYRRTRADDAATWPFGLDPALSFIENRLVCGIKLANQRIFEAARRDVRLRGMGTTIVAAAVAGEQICIAHVGDSRGYRVRDGAIARLTRDHSLLEEFKEANPNMTASEESRFPHKNVITRALGLHDTVEVAVGTHELKCDDIYLLCSDGLSGFVADEQLRRLSSKPVSLARAAAELVDAANRNGGHDNITTLLMHCVAV
jgi:serine/threonine protein phosphatase PrpC